MREEVIEALRRVFDDDVDWQRVLVAYLFGSKARGTDKEGSDVLLSSTPENLLDYYLSIGYLKS